MSMFDNYKYKDSGMKYNLTDNYKSIYKEVEDNHPYKTFDKNGNLIELKWNQTDKFILKDSIDKTIMVDSDARIYEITGEGPDENTTGDCCQKAYNTIDWRCWNCCGQHHHKYIWEEIPLTECINGSLKITFIRNTENKKIVCNIMNFRREIIYSYEFNHMINIPIDSESQPLLVQGQYYLEELLVSNTETELLKRIPITID